MVRLVTGLGLALLGMCSAFAAGKPDTSFGEGGLAVVHADYLEPFGEEIATDLVTDSQGRHVLVGEAQAAEMSHETVGLVVRRTPDGAPDETFGGRGFVHLRWQGEPLYFTHVDLAPDGGIIVAGVPHNALGQTKAPVVCKLLDRGDYDLSFGVGGCRALDSINGSAGLQQGAFDGLLVQPDGRILALGRPIKGDSDGRGFAIVRLLPDGRFDMGFGGVECAHPAPRCGMAFSPKNLGNVVDGAGLALDVDKASILIGGAVNVGSFQLLTAFRYTAQGDEGTVFEAVNFDDLTGDPDTFHSVSAVNVGSDGAVIVTGEMGFGMELVVGVVRYLPEGPHDPAFGVNGRATYVFDAQQKRNLAMGSFLQSDGRLLITGWTLWNDTCHLLRVDGKTGKRDLAFGHMGRLSPELLYGFDGGCFPSAGAVADKTSVMFVWSSETGGDLNPTLVRLDRDRLFADGLEQ